MEKSRVKQIEQEVSDATGLRKRNPKLFWTLVVGGLLALAAYGSYQFVLVRGLNSEVGDLKNEKGRLAEELRDVKAERDSAKGRLAPYEAIERKFPGDTDIERQRRVLERFERLADIFQQTSESLARANQQQSQTRLLNETNASKIIGLLQANKDFEVSISYEMGQRTTVELAMQLKQVFERAGWKITDFSSSMSFFTGIPPRLGLSVREVPPETVTAALVTLLDGLGVERRVNLNTNLPAKRLEIYVGPQ